MRKQQFRTESRPKILIYSVKYKERKALAAAV